MFSQQVANGLMLGSVYALIGIGYTLVFGVLRMLNLAHPYFFMLAPFIALLLMGAGLPPLIALLLALATASAFGVLLYFVVFRPVPSDRHLTGFVSSLSFGVILQVVVTNLYGTLPKPFLTRLPSPDFHLGPVILSGIQLGSLVLSLVLMAGLWLVIRRTPFGRNVRAIADNERAAMLLGIRVRRSVLLIFVISAGLAGLAGLMVALRFETIDAFMGDRFAFKALAVIIIGGIGDIRGAMLVGLALGVADVLFQAYAPSGWSEAFVWLAMIGTLVFLPEGLFGARVRRRAV
ncbi:MAG: branched-chain amino acid ABC transporter permease [Janthinobacterium lividum]